MNQRLRTDFNYNLQILWSVDLDKDWMQMPIIKACEGAPTQLLGFNYAMSSKYFNKGIHFYLDDYQFERVWNAPEKYVPILKKYDFVLSPDFSLYLDMPKPLQIYNVYRSRLLGAYWQSEGINVIPTLSWSDENSFDFAFDGLEKGGTVTVSTVGILKNEQAKEIWTNGMAEMIKRVNPKKILIYGKPIDFDFGNIDVIYFQNTNTERFEV